MDHAGADDLGRAIEMQHGGCAVFIEAVPVTETFNGNIVWEGTVHVFDITGHPEATRAYAWSSPVEGSKKRRIFAVLQQPPVKSAKDAVRAAIVHEYSFEKNRKG